MKLLKLVKKFTFNLTLLLLTLAVFMSETVFAQGESSEESGFAIVRIFNTVGEYVMNVLDAALFFEVGGFPFIVLWLITGGIIFSLL